MGRVVAVGVAVRGAFGSVVGVGLGEGGSPTVKLTVSVSVWVRFVLGSA